MRSETGRTRRRVRKCRNLLVKTSLDQILRRMRMVRTEEEEKGIYMRDWIHLVGASFGIKVKRVNRSLVVEI